MVILQADLSMCYQQDWLLYDPKLFLLPSSHIRWINQERAAPKAEKLKVTVSFSELGDLGRQQPPALIINSQNGIGKEIIKNYALAFFFFMHWLFKLIITFPWPKQAAWIHLTSREQGHTVLHRRRLEIFSGEC